MSAPVSAAADVEALYDKIGACPTLSGLARVLCSPDPKEEAAREHKRAAHVAALRAALSAARAASRDEAFAEAIVALWKRVEREEFIGHAKAAVVHAVQAIEALRGAPDGSHSNPVRTDVRSCARCGGNHRGLVFEQLERAIEFGGSESPMTHWAPCPANGQPVLLLRVEGGQ